MSALIITLIVIYTIGVPIVFGIMLSCMMDENDIRDDGAAICGSVFFSIIWPITALAALGIWIADSRKKETNKKV